MKMLHVHRSALPTKILSTCQNLSYQKNVLQSPFLQESGSTQIWRSCMRLLQGEFKVALFCTLQGTFWFDPAIRYSYNISTNVQCAQSVCWQSGNSSGSCNVTKLFASGNIGISQYCLFGQITILSASGNMLPVLFVGCAESALQISS